MEVKLVMERDMKVKGMRRVCAPYSVHGALNRVRNMDSSLVRDGWRNRLSII